MLVTVACPNCEHTEPVHSSLPEHFPNLACPKCYSAMEVLSDAEESLDGI